MISDKDATEIKIEWENCPDVDIAELKSLKNKEITYFEEPDSLKCGRLKKVSSKMSDGMDAVNCTALENVDPANFYIKTDLADPAACMIETNARIG